MQALMEWLENTAVATAVKESLVLTAGLSAVHLLGFTLLTGAALVSNLRRLGVFLSGEELASVTRPADRAIVVGLGISVVTGLLLFAPRAREAVANGIFELKMLLLVAAAGFQWALHRATAPAWQRPAVLRLAGAAGLALWTGLALAGCAYILLESQS